MKLPGQLRHQTKFRGRAESHGHFKLFTLKDDFPENVQSKFNFCSIGISHGIIQCNWIKNALRSTRILFAVQYITSICSVPSSTIKIGNKNEP